jgi:hypothetical protein
MPVSAVSQLPVPFGSRDPETGAFALQVLGALRSVGGTGGGSEDVGVSEGATSRDFDGGGRRPFRWTVATEL